MKIILLLTIQFVPLLVQLHWKEGLHEYHLFKSPERLQLSKILLCIYPLDGYTISHIIIVSINIIIIPRYLKYTIKYDTILVQSQAWSTPEDFDCDIN